MLSPNPYLAKSLIALFILLNLRQLPAQNRIEGVDLGIDTSEYLSSYYNDYLDYNLMIAASKGYDSEIERLLGKGADINAATSEGATPLVFAVSNNHTGAVKTLLAHNPEVNTRTTLWDTPLLISVKNGNPEISEALIRAGADIDMTDRYGVAPLHYASLYGNLHLADLLLYYEADVNQKATDGTTPLMAAVWAGYADISDFLMQNGANLEARDKEGFTPFLIAAQNGDTLLMNIFLREGVDLYEKNNNNSNALDLSIGSANKAAVEFLLEKGDKWFSADKDGINPYSVATAFGRKELFSLLEEKHIPGKPKRKIEEITVGATARINFRDFYSGISISGREPLLDAGILFGFDTKLWHTRVLMPGNEMDPVYYQYLDKSSVVYGGLFKDYRVWQNLRGSKLSLTASLMASYSFGYQLKGTEITPLSKIRPDFSAGIKLQISHVRLSVGLEYLKSAFYGIGPLWLRTGLGYDFFPGNVKSSGKVIKWY